MGTSRAFTPEFADALERRMAAALSPHAPRGTPFPDGWARAMFESWDPETELEDAIEFVASGFLDDLQDEVAMLTREQWPGSISGRALTPRARVDRTARVLRLRFVDGDDVVLDVPPIDLSALPSP